jgi:hypothetical protein
MDRLFKWPMEILRDESIAESVEYIKQLNYKPMLYIDGWWFETCRQINTKGLCLEFGVFEGASINFFSEKLSLSLLEARNFVTKNLMKLNFTKDLASCSLPPVACRLTLVARGLTPVACCLKSSAPEACRLPPGARNFYNL